MTNKKITIGLVVVAVIAIIAASISYLAISNSSSVGAAVTTTQVADFLPSIGITQLDMSQGCDQSYTCGSASNIPLHTYVTTGTLAFGTTTMAVIPNPFSNLGTSTVTVAYLYGGNSTTTVNYEMGTSTISAGQSLNATGSNISPTLINAQVSTTSQYFIASGVTVGPGTGATSAGAGTFTSIVVGPQESIVIAATSTYGGANSSIGNNGLLFPTATTTGTYKIEWQR